MDDPESLMHLDVLPRTVSDHNPILLSISKRRVITWGSTPFRHFQYWRELPGYSEQVESAWAVDTRGCAMIKLIHKLEATRDKLKAWCKGGANNLPNLIGKLKSNIILCQTLSERGQSEAVEQECNLKRELTKLLILEERLWRQKARIKWMREGDLNPKFFQGIANGRRRRNRIAAILHEGRTLTDMPDLFSAGTSFFVALLGTSHGDGCLPQSLAPGSKVSLEENAELLKSTTYAEIKWAVMKVDKDSAPGPDGFGNGFFQSNWPTVQEAVAGAIRDFFQSRRLVKSINKTHITLLPNERGATHMDKFRPISLCNSILKFIIRIMFQNFRRLKLCLDEFLSGSGMVMNPEKSTVLPFNMASQAIQQLEHQLGWRIGQIPTTYLGIPLQTGNLKEAQCRQLTLKASQKLLLWKQKPVEPNQACFLDGAGLLEFSCQTSVVYLQSTEPAAEFLWGDSKSPHRISWSTLCLPKSEGGVGLRDLRATNSANMAFLVFRVSEQASPWASLIRGRYCERKGLLDCTSKGKRVSKAWQTAVRAWSRIKEQVVWKVGNGTMVKFWTDSWGNDRLIDKIPPSHLHLVQDCISFSVQETLEVNEEDTRAFFESLNVQVSWSRVQAEQANVLAWKNTGNSIISRYEIWQRTRKKGDEQQGHILVWKGRWLPRAVWAVYVGSAGRLPLDDLIKRKGRHLASRCYVCKQASEDTQHLYFDCKGAKPIWALIYGKFGRTAPWHGSPPNIKIGLNRWHINGFKDKSLDKCWKDSFHIAIWFIWKTRNQFKHRGDIPLGNMANQFWSHCREHWWSYQWKDSQHVKVHNWLRTGILWSNGIKRGDTWVEISISSLFKAGRKGVAGLIRDAAGRFRHGLACWFPNNSVSWETEVLMECLGTWSTWKTRKG
ncbi:putative ribonuclease H protein [Nymphaea thermarum]|nr:putative ribonuclease H protein [Nymphaea thermarum]